MAQPGDAGWKWFPNVKSGWSLDVVNLLVVIGESSIAEHSQTITASLPGILPRLLPAPQALLKPARPTRMPETHARMTGVYSGTTLESVGYFANIITPLDSLPAYSFTVLDIKHSYKESEDGGFIPFVKRTLSRMRGNARGHNNPLPRHHSINRDHIQDLVTAPTVARGDDHNRLAVPAKLFSPIHILSIISCGLSIGIIIMAILCQDGTAVLAVTLISLASTVVGYASFWRPILMERKQTNEVPDGDVLIRTREGAFVLIKCSENVARELYSGTEECEYYVGGNAYRAFMALGTMLLMVSVVLLGNCTWELKVFIGSCYIVLNGLYWGLGMIPRTYFWDLSRYECKDITPVDAVEAHRVTNEGEHCERCPSFTRTLWYAIRETKLTGWVERSGAAPGTEQWKQWLQEAQRAAACGNRTWPAVQRKNEILVKEGKNYDLAAQHAPVTEVRMPSHSVTR